MLDLGVITSTKILSPSNRKGHIQIIIGPMFSGKTTELIRRLKRYQISNHTCLMINYAQDSRCIPSDIAQVDRQSLVVRSETVLHSLERNSQIYSVIGIDEGQFFPDIVSFAEEMANSGKIVIIAALDGTYQRQGFGEILNLVPLAENVVKLAAVCMICFESASYTKRIGSETELEVIGGTDKYMAVCRSCHKKTFSGSSQNKNTEINTLSDIANIPKVAN